LFGTLVERAQKYPVDFRKALTHGRVG